MSVQSDKIRLQHIRDAARKIIAFTQGETRESLARDEKLQLAVVRLIEIIGEASSRLTDDLKQQYPAIPWLAVVGMRNRIVHAYFDIDLNVVWDTAVEAIPTLLAQVEDILSDMESD